MATQYEKDLPVSSEIEHVRGITSGGESVRTSLAARVREVTLTGLSMATKRVIATGDSILQALGILQAQITGLDEAKQAKLPHTADTYVRRNSANDDFEAKTPQQVANEINPLLLASVYMTYGGTADAITLTSPGGAHLTALVAGMQFRFRATAANTGAMTIAVDGLTAVTAKTITGADTPADYIRTDVDTVATFDGTNFIVDRQIERGSNANGEYVRYADGTQACTFTGDSLDSTSSVGSIYRTSSESTWTYPVPFSVAPFASCTVNVTTRWAAAGTSTTTSCAYRQYSANSVSSMEPSLLTSRGRWY